MIASSAEPANTSAFTKADLVRPWVSTIKVIAAPFDVPLGLADRQIRAAGQALEAEWDFDAAITFRHWYGLGVGDPLLTPSGQVADGCDEIQPRESRMILGTGRLDQFLCPCGRFVVLGEETDESDERGDGGRGVEIIVVGSPPKRITQVGEFGARTTHKPRAAAGCPTAP